MTRHREPCCTCDNHKLYGLTCDDFDELLERSDNLCEICRCRAESSVRGVLHIDHGICQGRVVVRGLLCSRCNTNLGRDGYWIGELARLYLERAAMTWAALGYRPPELDVADKYARSSQPAILEITELSEHRRRTKVADDAALAERNARIYDLKTSGAITQADICRAADLTREQIIRILKAEEERRAKVTTHAADQP